MKKIIIIIVGIFTSIIISGCGVTEEIDIYASIYPLQFLVEEIVDDNMSVKGVYPMGAEIHEYEPAPSQIVSMSKSKLIFYIGASLEAFIEKAEGTTLPNNILVKMSKYVPMLEPSGEEEDKEHDTTGHHHPIDPHIWLDPIRMITMAEKITEKVSMVMPEKKAEFEENRDELISKLQTLHNGYLEVLNHESVLHKVIVVDHDAYLYWQDRYGIERIKTRIDNDSCTIIPTDFIQNIELIKSYGIKYITVTENASVCSIIDQYIKEASLEKEYLHDLSTISKKDYNAGRDYFYYMEENLETLKRILPKKLTAK